MGLDCSIFSLTQLLKFFDSLLILQKLIAIRAKEIAEIMLEPANTQATPEVRFNNFFFLEWFILSVLWQGPVSSRMWEAEKAAKEAKAQREGERSTSLYGEKQGKYVDRECDVVGRCRP